jgi:glutathione S-transferase
MKLYYAPGSCALAAHIALEEVGADYTAERIDLKAGQQTSAGYLAVNPKGRVPALATARGILTETPAILAFIAQSYPWARLAPLDDPFAFAQAQSVNSYICSTLHVAHAHRHRGARWASNEASLEDMRRKVPENMAACFGMIERTMFRGPWVMGDDYTICDPYLFTVARWMESDGVRPSDFPAIEAHMTRMSERPAVRKVLAFYPA